LLERGADALQWGRAFENNLPIHAACAGRRIGKAAFSKLVAATGDPDVTPKHGYTPLMEAALNGSSDAVDVLLAAGPTKPKTRTERPRQICEGAGSDFGQTAG
jgi:ankyrin repeat protein